MSLRTQLSDCQSRLHEIHDEIEGIGTAAENDSRDISDDEAKIIDDLRAEFEGLESKEKTLKGAVEASDRAKRERVIPDSVQNALVPQAAGGNRLPASVRGQRTKHFESNADAYAMGRWLYGMIGHEESKNWCRNNGIDFRNDQSVGTPGAGGYTVPTPLAATIIRLVEEYGVFRQHSYNAAMSAMTLDVPRRTGPLTVVYPGEGTAITPSDLVVDQVNLVAKKYALLNIMSTELAEDAIISWTDLVAEECAWSLALAEDTNSFLGDGTATYGGITGIDSALGAGARLTGSGAGFGGIALTDLEQLCALPPAYAGFQGRWYMSRYAYFSSVVSLLNTAGGTDMRQIEAGGDMMLMGYPVTFTQVLPGSAGVAGDLAIVFGDLSLGSILGTRRQLSLRLLTELYAASDQLGIVCTMRSDTVIHDVGTDTECGAIAGLFLGGV